jgi:endo-alpha-1,4-polygalactosaminidase (GH114 family)
MQSESTAATNIIFLTSDLTELLENAVKLLFVVMNDSEQLLGSQGQASRDNSDSNAVQTGTIQTLDDLSTESQTVEWEVLRYFNHELGDVVRTIATGSTLSNGELVIMDVKKEQRVTTSVILQRGNNCLNYQSNVGSYSSTSNDQILVRDTTRRH